MREARRWFIPLIGLGAYGLAVSEDLGHSPSLSALEIVFALALGMLLIGSVFSAVHHAEAIAHRTGEPFGTLILTAAVTIIELALIVSVMVSGEGNPALARDTVYAVVMIVCNGLVGLCLLSGGIRFREQTFDLGAVSIYLAVLIVLATLTLVLPNYALSAPGPFYTNSQLAFVSAASILLYAVFLYTQTIRHREYFVGGSDNGGAHQDPHSSSGLWASGILLVLSILVVVLLAKKLSVLTDHALISIGAPRAVNGLIIALLVLLPEGVAALQAAKRDELQKALNLSLGSSLATIGLTIPSVAVLNLFLKQDLVLGLEPKESVLLILTFAASILTLGTGKTNLLFGFVHLVIFGTFVFLTVVP